MGTWFASLALSFFLERSNTLHLFFLLIPVWIFATVAYLSLTSMLGARATYEESESEEWAELVRKQQEREFLDDQVTSAATAETLSLSRGITASRLVSLVSMFDCAALSIVVYHTGDLASCNQ